MSILLKRISDLEKENANLDYMLEMCNGRIEELEAENTSLQRKLNESIDDNYKNAWKIQQQAERGANFAQKENARLREALELIAKSNFYFARGEEDKQLSRVCEIARNALNGNEK